MMEEKMRWFVGEVQVDPWKQLDCSLLESRTEESKTALQQDLISYFECHSQISA